MGKLSANRALQRFGFRQTLRGALIIAVIGGLMMGAYGTIIVKTYPTQKARDALVQTLKATPAINFLSGEVENAGTAASYGIYKSLPMMTLITSIWGLLVVTRLLRGNEEDGRLELLQSGATTKRAVATHLLVGFGYSLLVAAAVMWVITTLLGMAPHVNLSAASALYLTLIVFLPGAVFASLGAVTSQLTVTRGRAVMYGLVPLIILYCVRGAANTSSTYNWLKSVSPFGWSDLTNAVLNPQLLWLLPPLILAAVCTAFGLYWAGRRDYGMSLLPHTDSTYSHFDLLSSPLAFTIRQKRWAYLWWLVGTVAFVAFMASLAGTVSNLLHDSPEIAKFIAANPDQLKLAFIGSTIQLLCSILLIFAILEISSIRRDEARLYLDNLLTQPVRRSSWLAQRAVISTVAVLIISFAAVIIVWNVATTQNVTLNLGILLANGLGALSCVFLLLGFGVALYGYWPRIAVIGMSIVVGWTFVVDIIRSLLHLNDWIDKTSLLHYLSTNPSRAPEWSTIVWLIIIGLILSAIGVRAFMRRDIVTE